MVSFLGLNRSDRSEIAAHARRAPKSSLIVHPRARLTGATPRKVARIQNQDIGCCVGCSFAYALELSLTTAPVSPYPTYRWARETEGTQSSDSGTSLLAAAQIIPAFGFCFESEYAPETISAQLGGVHARARLKAWKRKVQMGLANKHIHVYEAIDQARIKAALIQACSVVIGIPVTSEIVDLRPGAVYQGNGIIIGGHAMCAVGWDQTGLMIVNSWGSDWCDGGYGVLSWDAISAAPWGEMAILE